MITFQTVSTPEKILVVAGLAEIIWTAHYTPIIGKDQVNYMVENFQSKKAIASQIDEGYEYYLIYTEETPVGYICIQQQKTELFLSKIYVLSSFRGRKIGKKGMEFVEEQAKLKDCNTIGLTVNKFNDKSIAAYEKMGFTNKGSTIKDIGNGFIMDDYKMEKLIR